MGVHTAVASTDIASNCRRQAGQSLFRLVAVDSDKTNGIFSEGLLAHLTTEDESSSAPGDPRGRLVGTDKHAAHRIGFAARALQDTASYLDKPNRPRNALESPRRQRNVVAAGQIANGVAEISVIRNCPAAPHDATRAAKFTVAPR